jgi:hypothetical protein
MVETASVARLHEMRFRAFGITTGFLLLMICELLISCRASSPMDDAYAKELLEAKQRCCKIVIGQDYHGNLEYLDVLSDYAFHSTSLPSQSEVVSIDLARAGQVKLMSSDAQWSAKCSGTSCTISSETSSARSIRISRMGMLTPLFWSPDKMLIFYLVKGPTWRTPARCSLEDERDIVLIEAASGRRGVVKTVCGGFPYERLRWFNLPETH